MSNETETAVRSKPAGLLDRAIAIFSPEAAQRRIEARGSLEMAIAQESRRELLAEQARKDDLRDAEYRQTIENLHKLQTRAYDAAVYNPTTPRSAYSRSGPNELIGGALENVRAQLRDLMRNDEVGQAAVDASVDLIHGGGIHPRADVRRFSDERNDEINDIVMARYFSYCESIDIDVHGQNDLVGMIDLGLNAERGSDGEFIILKKWHSRAEVQRRGLKHPLKLEMIEPDWLVSSTIKSFTYRNKDYPVVSGVVVDPDTKETFGYLFYESAGPSGTPSGSYKFVPAKFVIHYFDPKRPGQRRGISGLVRGLYTFRDLRELAKAGLDRMKVSTAFMMVLGIPAGKGANASMMGEYDGFGRGGEAGAGNRENIPADGRLRNSYGGIIETVSSNQVARVAEGTEVTTVEPPAATGLLDLYRLGMQRVAAAAGVTYEALSKDYSQATFASLRLSSAPVLRRAKKLRWKLIVKVYQDIFKDWVTGCYTMDSWGYDGFFSNDMFRHDEVEWIEPMEDASDPKAEAEARRMDLENGVIDHTDIWRGRGLDPRQQLKKMASTKNDAKKLGIDLDRYIWARNNSNVNRTSSNDNPEDVDDNELGTLK